MPPAALPAIMPSSTSGNGRGAVEPAVLMQTDICHQIGSGFGDLSQLLTSGSGFSRDKQGVAAAFAKPASLTAPVAGTR